MAKGQKRSGREPKKPKAAKKPVVPTVASRFQTPTKPETPKDKGK